MSVQPIPIDPQPDEDLRDRYLLALSRLWTQEDLDRGETPGRSRDYVLDTVDGIRFVVSRERFVQFGPEEVVHFSASLNPSGDAMVEFRARRSFDVIACLAWFVSRFRLISGYSGVVEFVGLSPGKQVPHWCFRAREVR